MKKYIIETYDLCKKSGNKFRVKDVNLAVPQGCIYGFLGPNGAGKTTTMKLLLGLIQPDGGTVEILGQKMSPRNRFDINMRTGSLIESPGFYGHLTGQENLEIIARYKNLGTDDIKEALNTVNLYDRKDDKVKNYSLGMKQRLGIAMALMGKPELIILDEPTNGLDPAGINEIRNLVKSIPEKCGSTVIISSHLLSEVEQIADYVGIINKGKMIYQGLLSELEIGDASLEEVFLEMTKGA
ncbi:MAG: ABC transporter ATP-binding protein [Butyrivibrio sp.]|nr:ABC transporter ATP-binding protein [Butyrivibrio sp.]